MLTAKSAQIPLHIWLPDALNLQVSALIHAAILESNSWSLSIGKIPFSFYPVSSRFCLSTCCGDSSVTRLFEIVQNDVNKILAYSTALVKRN